MLDDLPAVGESEVHALSALGNHSHARVHEAAARTEEFHCRCAGHHGGTVRADACHVNLFSAEKFPNQGHFEFQRHRETGCFCAGLNDLAYYRQIDRCQQGLRLTPQDIPFLSGLIQREIIYRILSGPEGARLRAIATLGDQSHRTAKAIAWIKANYAKPLRVEALAQTAGMGLSTLHHHFRELTAMSPQQKLMRMVWTPPVRPLTTWFRQV